MLKSSQEKNDLKEFQAVHHVQAPRWTSIFAKVLCGFFSFLIILLFLTPWQQTSEGSGQFMALDPNDRVQKINATVGGRINKWFVSDGAKVKKGDSILEIVDNDPLFVDRLRLERDAVFRKYEAAKSASETALLILNRQRGLFKEGLASEAKVEKSFIDYKKLLAIEATSAANLAKSEVKLSRQKRQLITAPRDGSILRILHGSGSVVVKEGDVLAVFVPKDIHPAVEIFVNGNDLPLVYPGRKVRIQFEGWPAVQFSGWPSVAVGTFGGVVSVVDSSISKNGKFRVLVTPDKGVEWPSSTYLRQGTRVYGWILLNSVTIGYEIWRQFNGFPASLDNSPDSGKDSLKKGDKEKKSKEKYYKDPYKS